MQPDPTPAPSSHVETFLTDVDAARYLCCVSVRAFRDLHIDYIKMGKQRVYRLDDLNAYALSRRHAASGPTFAAAPAPKPPPSAAPAASAPVPMPAAAVSDPAPASRSSKPATPVRRSRRANSATALFDRVLDQYR